MTNPDICIIGGGVMGSCLKLALSRTTYSVLQCEAKPFVPPTDQKDIRAIGLNQASIDILKWLNLWEALKVHATPILQIDITSQGQFGAARLKAAADQPLGVVIPMYRIMETIQSALDTKTTLYETTLTDYDPQTQKLILNQKNHIFSLKPRLIVAADGLHSFLQERLKLKPHITKNHHALVTTLTLKRDHQYIAYERFTRQGPLALLPLAVPHAGLVCCLPPTEIQTLSSLSDPDFLNYVQTAFGYRAGRFIGVSERLVFPFEQRFLPNIVYPDLVFIGNAAQTVHPASAQGVNLGLRDVKILTNILEQFSLKALDQYQQTRQPDRIRICHAIRLMVELFTHHTVPWPWLRSMGLSALNLTNTLQSTVVKYASGTNII